MMNLPACEEDTSARGLVIHSKSSDAVDERRNHPVAQALRAMARSATSHQVLKTCIESTQSTRYAVMMLAPATILRRQVVVLVDWTRSGKILPLALPAYSTHLRKAQGRVRLTKEFCWVLHYPELLLDDGAHRDLLDWLRIGLPEITPVALDRWSEILHQRLVIGRPAAEIARAIGERENHVSGLLREARRVFAQLRLPNNPLDPFRIGRALWGTFHLEWDDVAGSYGGVADQPMHEGEIRRLGAWMSSLEWPVDTHLGLMPAYGLSSLSPRPTPTKAGLSLDGLAGSDDPLLAAEIAAVDDATLAEGVFGADEDYALTL